MKHLALYLAIAAALAASCTVQEKDFQTPNQDDVVFYASFEQPGEEGTKVYANEDLLLRWTADDRVSIFNKITYNQQYRFIGETGDYEGGFNKVDDPEFMTGQAISHVISVYPYQRQTRVSEEEVITVTLPAEQSYAQNSFGLGDNTMISVSSGNLLQYRSVSGFLVISLYGEGMSVNSIILRGNNGERIAGEATVTMPLDGTPTAVMADDATTEITLTCASPVQLSASAEESTLFWFVVPPVVFSKGFTITVNESTGGVVEKSTSKNIAIERNKLSKMAPTEIEDAPPAGNIVFADDKVKDRLVAAFDTNGDGELSYAEAAAVSSIDGVITIKTITSFDEFQYFTNVNSVPDSYFSGCSKLTSIVLPKSITYIGKSAFYNCPQLTSISIPNGVEFIGDCAFQESNNIRASFHLNQLAYLGGHAFEDCSLLYDFSICFADGATSIGEYALRNCSGLSSISIPNTVTSIGRCAFVGCSGLSSITLPDCLTVIENGVFSGCTGLSTISIPESVTSIGSSAFNDCSGLTSLFIPKNINSISNTAFNRCTGLLSISVDPENSFYDSRKNCNALIETAKNDLFLGCRNSTIPEGVTSITGAFYACSELKSISIPESVITLGDGAFKDCTGLTSIFLPESVITIGRWVFEGCENLAEINIPESVTSLGESALMGCAFSSIALPSSLKSLSYRAISECPNLSSITILAATPPSIQNDTFYNTNGCPIYVPSGSVEAYKTSYNWKSYADRIQPIPSTITLVPEAVDMGLSVKWASFNLGASKPEEYGDYFAWGETEPHYICQDPLIWKEGKSKGYAWFTYKWCMGASNTLTKYCYDSEYGYSGFTDTKIDLDPEDDVAHVNLGGNWRMPTVAEWEELINNCTWTWKQENGINGRKVTSKKNGISIFLPAAGYRLNTSLGAVGSIGNYWSSSLATFSPGEAQSVGFGSGGVYGVRDERYFGFSVRPVYAE